MNRRSFWQSSLNGKDWGCKGTNISREKKTRKMLTAESKIHPSRRRTE